MDPAYEESRPIMPRNLTLLLAGVLLATWAFMFVSKYVFYPKMNIWIIIVSGVIFAIVALLCLFMRFTMKVYEDRVEIQHDFRKVVIPKEEIIDTRSGELSIIKNYAGWNIKGVKYRTWSAIGEDLGIGLKLTGKRVMFFSVIDPDKIVPLLPKEEKKEEEI